MDLITLIIKAVGAITTGVLQGIVAIRANKLEHEKSQAALDQEKIVAAAQKEVAFDESRAEVLNLVNVKEAATAEEAAAQNQVPNFWVLILIFLLVGGTAATVMSRPGSKSK